MKPGVKIGLGICLSLATAGSIYVYDSYIKDRIDSAEVVVVKAGTDISKAQPITQNQLTIERRAKDSLVDNVVYAKDINKIIGQDAQQEIVGNSMISLKMVDFDGVVPNTKKGEAIRPITKNMIFAQPGSLRRKDVVDIYLVYQNGSTNLDTNGPSTVSSASGAAATNNSNGNAINSVIKDQKPFLKGIKVVYVKDSSNKEVVASPDDKNGNDPRLNATSNISDLEIILNEDDFTKLMDQVLSKGAKLYITYQ